MNRGVSCTRSRHRKRDTGAARERYGLNGSYDFHVVKREGRPRLSINRHVY